MARNFKELEGKMKPDSLARAKQQAKEMMAEMLFATKSDLQISALERLVHALGGEVEIIAHLPGRDVRIR